MRRKPDIKVQVVADERRTHYQLRWVDLRTGKKRKESSGVVNDGKAKSRAAAERVAGDKEKQLRAQRADLEDITWERFRDRYESEVLPAMAERSGGIVASVFNQFERVAKPRRLSELTEETFSTYASTLRDGLPDSKTGAAVPRSEATIKHHLAHLKAALRWAERQKLIDRAPMIDMPKRAKGSKVMKGRPITLEEFERMLSKVPAVLFPRVEGKPAKRRAIRHEQAYQRLVADVVNGQKPDGMDATLADAGRTRAEFDADIQDARDMVESWRHYLRGLWLSGLRLTESLELYWDRSDKLCIDLAGRRPMLRIPAELEKGNQDRILPLSPEFAEFLLATPKADRRGPVFKPLAHRAYRTTTGYVGPHKAGARIVAIGKAAGVKVNTSGALKYASAHDLRRSFGERWAARVMPQVLMELMRHESIETTMRYYVGRNAERTANVLWEAHEKAGSPTLGPTLPQQEGVNVDFLEEN